MSEKVEYVAEATPVYAEKVEEITTTEVSKKTYLDNPKPNLAVYLWLAKFSRANEDENQKLYNGTGTVLDLIRKGEKHEIPKFTGVPPVVGWNLDEEKAEAHRAMRAATWLTVFFLITTDILGPYSCPWAFAQLGYGPGFAIYLVLGVAAVYTGWQLWSMYIQLDSEHYPIMTYSDIADRVFGVYAKHAVNFLQTIQLFFNVGVIVLGNGMGLAEIVDGAGRYACFSGLVLAWAGIGMIIGQIRSLKNFGFLANSAIWLNVIVILITMVGVAIYEPYYAGWLVSQAPGTPITPIVATAQATGSFTSQVVGVMQIVYSYGGAMMFVEFMAEMRRPFDFWKGMIYAQLFIFTIYVVFGMYVYHWQGQYVINPANQGISNYALQTVGNVISLVAALIAAGLYGNVGMKVIYQTMVIDIFHGPELDTYRGKVYWAVLVVIYWATAFVIGSAVPQFSNISGLVSAVCIVQFSYTFPPLFMCAFEIQKDAITESELVDETTGLPGEPVDTWWNWSRWARGIAPRWYVKLFNFLLFLAALAMACIGMYSAGTGIQEGFASGSAVTSFGCVAPA